MKKTDKDDQVIIRIEKKLKKRAFIYAKMKGVNLSSLVRQSLEKEMNNEFQDNIKAMLDSFVKENRIKLKQFNK